MVGTLNLPGSTCSAGTFPTGIDNAGEVTGCTDLVTQAELAVWPGTTNLVTLGTITTGTWHGNEITDAYLADTHTHTDNTIEVADLVTSSGTASSSTYYRGDGAWGTPEGSGNVSQLAHDLYVKNVTENDNTLLFRADTDITITRLDCIIDPSEDAGTDNVTVTYYECNSNGDSCSLTGASVIATNITASDTSFVNASIDNTDWVSVGFSSIEGSPTNLNCTLVYTVD